MSTISEVPRPEEVTGPAAEPVTTAEARKHLEINASDTTHDDQINSLIEAARQKWENDTQEFYIERSMRVKLPYMCEYQFPHRPVSAITSITYYDGNNDSQTLSSSTYDLDTARSQLRLAYLATFPTTAARWDAVTVNYTLGSHSASTTVPEIARSAMKLLIGFWFENRDMLGAENYQTTKPYEMLVANYMRSSYP